MESSPQLKLPVINLSAANLSSTSSSWLTKCVEVTGALEEYGCFIAIYDGVSQELHDEIFVASQDLFDLPNEVKVLNTSDTHLSGYVARNPIIPFNESLGIENVTTTQEVEKFTNLMWPAGNESFCKNASMFSKAVAKLEQIVMRMVAKTYGVEQNYELLLGSTTYLFKLLKYQSPQENEGNLGVVAHTDKSFMSVLHQNGVNGLEVETKDGEWIKVDLTPSSFVVMAGEASMAWTNGRIEAPVHKVIMQGNDERFSLGVFSFIRDLNIEIPKELVDEDHPRQFEAFDHYKYINYYMENAMKNLKCPIRSYCGI